MNGTSAAATGEPLAAPTAYERDVNYGGKEYADAIARQEPAKPTFIDQMNELAAKFGGDDGAFWTIEHRVNSQSSGKLTIEACARFWPRFKPFGLSPMVSATAGTMASAIER